MNRIEAAKQHGLRVLYLATIIWEAIADMVDLECPHCQEQLEIPSVEDIRNWLEKESDDVNTTP